ncbi:hypothetical protein GGS20DRAFT_528933 [Poronia punctata]|nr:hypothetical protein GGS20DRAFT_528933 [Poronia punctata]
MKKVFILAVLTLSLIAGLFYSIPNYPWWSLLAWNGGPVPITSPIPTYFLETITHKKIIRCLPVVYIIVLSNRPAISRARDIQTY